jgi:hypothetical protein
MVSEQRRWMLTSAAMVMVGLACGPTKAPDKGKGATNDPPKTAPITDTKPAPKPEIALPAVWQQVPASAFMAIAFHHATQSTANLRDVLSKMGVFAEFYKEADLDGFQQEFGVDFFDAEAAKKVGVDDSKGVAIVFDSKFLFKNYWYQEYAATVEINKEPAVYAILPLADEKTFDTWMRTTITKQSSGATFEEEQVGDTKFVFVMKPSNSGLTETPSVSPSDPVPPVTPPATGPSAMQLNATFVFKNKSVYIFDHNIRPAETKDMPNFVAEFKTDLKKYVESLSTSITTTSAFSTVTKKLNTNGDGLMFMDVNGFVAYSEAELNREMIYLAPQNESQKQAQEEQKKYAAESVSWRNEDLSFYKQMAALFPAWGMSAQLKKDSKDGAICEGYAMLGPAANAAFGTLMNLSTEPPPYGTMFPEDTTFVYRETINFSALKSVFELFISEKDKADFNSSYEQMKIGATAILGLDLEKDIIGAFTGHIAFGAPDLSILAMPFLISSSSNSMPPFPGGSLTPIERAPVPSEPALEIAPSLLPQYIPAGARLMAPMPPPPRPTMVFPAVVGIAQLTSPAAGDKLVEALLRIAPLTGMQYKTEEVSGTKIYSIEIEKITMALARVDSYMVFSTNIEKLKQTIERIKKPSTNFTDKLKTSMSKSLVNDKNTSGCTGDVGGLFSWILRQPELNMSADEISTITKLSASLGTSTMKFTHEDKGLAFMGEQSLR